MVRSPLNAAALGQEYLRERLHYESETGGFTWLRRLGCDPETRRWNTRYAGERAGAIRKDRGRELIYLQITIDGKNYIAHRLAWLYMKGEFPPRGIDHNDGDGLNNRWDNLRLANQSENVANSCIRSDNTSGFKGVSFDKSRGSYQASIQVRGKRKNLGRFDIAEDASAAYVAAARKYFGEFAKAM